jgi:hypothetical protein
MSLDSTYRLPSSSLTVLSSSASSASSLPASSLGSPILSASLRSHLLSTVGFLPDSALAWLYCCRGLYQIGSYSLCIEGLQNCIRSESCSSESQHLLAFCFLHLKQEETAFQAFQKSVDMNNQTDWQALVELAIGFEQRKESRNSESHQSQISHN